MKKRLLGFRTPGLLFALLAALAFLAGSCRKEEPGPLVPADYLSWDQTIRKTLDYPIPGHEDQHRRIFINAVGKGVQVQERDKRVYYDYPQGTIIVKEIYPGLQMREGEKPAMLTVMIKKSKDPRSRGGWLWVVKDMTKNTERIIDYELCFDCHSNANEPHPYGDRNGNNEFRDYAYYPYRP